MDAGERHWKDPTDHAAAAELLTELRALQQTAEGRAACWADLCAAQSMVLPRLLHGSLHWCNQATLPALKVVTAALSAKPSAKTNSDGCEGHATPYSSINTMQMILGEINEEATAC